MHELTMIIEAEPAGREGYNKVIRVWLDGEEVPTEGRTVVQWLDHVKAQGWVAGSSSVTTRPNGVRIIYDFRRPTIEPAA